MGSKTITISDAAYESLLKEKLENESYSDVILRLTKRFGSIFDSFGKWDMSKEEEETMKDDLEKMWSAWSNNIQKKDED
ncbi:MAG: antitoxin [Candidatus Lokiarchaeota archaeon]|nr:antitoxin [Candidatus Lokiarchaeota archaeon]